MEKVELSSLSLGDVDVRIQLTGRLHDWRNGRWTLFEVDTYLPTAGTSWYLMSTPSGLGKSFKFDHLYRDLRLWYALRNVFLMNRLPCFIEVKVFDLFSDEIPHKPLNLTCIGEKHTEPANGGADRRTWPLPLMTNLSNRVNKAPVGTVGSLAHS